MVFSRIKISRKLHAQENPTRSKQRNIGFFIIAGVLLFLASFLQQAGLQFTTAANAGFITSLYVILVPILLRLFWRERIPAFAWMGAGTAVVGSLLLSTKGGFGLSQGDLLELAGALFWGLHVILIGKVVRGVDLISFAYGQYFVAGILNLLFGVWLEKPIFYGVSLAWWGILYTGIISIALGYTLQIYAQRYSPPTDAVILLSMEAVFAAVFGYLLLDESLAPQQILGCVLILIAIILTAMRANKAYHVEGIEIQHDYLA